MVRHGATDWNRDHRFQGQVDIPLNEQGRAQARALAAMLKDEPFERILSSDLSRALDTARAIAGEREVEADMRWREFAFGGWEGLTWSEIIERWPDVADTHTAAARYAPPGGETFDEVRRRVADALRSLRAANVEHALVVTHAGPLHAVLHELLGERARTEEVLGVRFLPASITSIRLDGDGAEILALNEVAHLPMR